jgi:uncharacterized protein YutE (UPF0331/DUF86 family)
MDKDLITAKASAVKRHLDRIKSKRRDSLADFLDDLDRQESVLFNLQMAIQNCVDMAAHIVSEGGLGAPGSTNEMFYLLGDEGYLDRELTEKMVRAEGFRNLMAHQYEKVDLKRVFEVAHKDIMDLDAFVRSILKQI